MTNVPSPSFTEHNSALLLIDPETATAERANEQFKRRFNPDMEYLRDASWSDIFPSGTVDQLWKFRNNKDMPLLTIEETCLSVSNGERHDYYVSLNAIWWEGEQARILLQMELLENQFKGEHAHKDARKEKLRFFNHLLYHFPDTIYFKDCESRFLLINDKQAEVLGVDHPDDAIGKTDFDFFPDEQAREAYQDEKKILETGEPLVNKRERVTGADGVDYWVSTTKVPIKNREGDIVGTMGVTRDISKQKDLEDENQRLLNQERKLREKIEKSYQELQIQKNRFQGAFDKAAIGMAIVSTEGKFLRVNDSLCEMLGYPEEELKELKFQDITHPDDLQKDEEHLQKLLDGDIDSYTMEKRYFHKEGSIIWTILNVSLVRDNEGAPLHFVSQVQDITERKEYEQKINKSLEEKQVLLEEIHHRVKNNLASVSGILELQVYNVENKKVKQVLQDAQSRIYTMALVHEQLYEHDSLSNIVLGSFVEQLIETINNSLNTKDKHVQPHVDAQQVTLEVTKAVPCGLIINELVTNAYKHGFEGREKGNIWVRVRQQNSSIQVDIEDDGIGLPDDFSLENQDTLGVNLINTLLSQLDADISYENKEGAYFRITFPLSKE